MDWWDNWDSDWADPEILEEFRESGEWAKQVELNRRKLGDNLEFSISAAEEMKKHLHKIGLWTATSLAPYPLSSHRKRN